MPQPANGRPVEDLRMTKSATMTQIYTRSLLVGGVLGLYFSYFFKSVHTPDISFSLKLAFIATVVIDCVQAMRTRPPVRRKSKE